MAAAICENRDRHENLARHRERSGTVMRTHESHPSDAPGQAAPATDAEPESPAQRSTPRAAAVQKDPHVGKVLGGQYVVGSLLGKGGMGRVYRGLQRSLQRDVAIKILNQSMQQNRPEFARRFVLEAQAAAQIVSSYTITVHDHGVGDEGELYIVMEYLRGHSLAQALRAEPFDLERALRVAIDICRGIGAAHKLGIIHRDLKPANIFLIDRDCEGERAKVLDFGLAKLFQPEAESSAHGRSLPERETELTRSDTILGSPRYMSPEQILCRPIDVRADIYSLGVILFHMLAGRPPYGGSDSIKLMHDHVYAPVPRLDAIRPPCPARLEEIVTQCLSKAPDGRYASMEALLVELHAVQRSVNAGERALQAIEPERADAEIAQPVIEATLPLEPRRRHRSSRSAALAALCLLFSILAGLFWPSGAPAPVAPDPQPPQKSELDASPVAQPSLPDAPVGPSDETDPELEQARDIQPQKSAQPRSVDRTKRRSAAPVLEALAVVRGGRSEVGTLELKLKLQPGAPPPTIEVFIDGESRGYLSTTVHLTSGTHRVRFSRAVRIPSGRIDVSVNSIQTLDILP